MTGEDITANVRTVRGVPPKLLLKDPPPLIEVRGEMYFPVKAFEELNEELTANGAAAVREPAQRRGGLAAAEGPQGDVLAAAAPVGALVRGRGGGRVRFASRVPGVGGRRRGCPVPPTTDGRGLDRGGRGVPHQLGGHRHSVDWEIDGAVIKVDRRSCSGSSAPPRTRRGGRSRSSSRRRNAPRC